MTPPLPDPAGMFERAPELVGLALADAGVAKAIRRGDPHAVYRALSWARLRGRLTEHRPVVDALLAHRPLFVSPTRRPPVLHTVNGIGASVYGASDRDPDGSYIKTHFLVFVFMPVFPLSQYLVRDAERGWYFLGKVPMSTPLRIWNRLVVAAILFAVLAGALQAFHSSRYHVVHVVNGLPWPVHVTIGPTPYDVPARQRREASVRTGRQAVRVTSAGGQPVESGELQVEAGPDLLVWNVLGAAPLVERTVVYQSTQGALSPPAPHFFCGERSIKRSQVDYTFAEPPPSIQMPQGQTVAYRRHFALLPLDLDACVNAIAGAGKAEPALALAKALALLDTEGTRTGLAVRLCRAVGKPDEAMSLAEQALKQHPDSVEHHRAYQSIAEDLGRTAELRSTYKARFDAAPDNPDAAYLYARVLPDDEALALAADFAQKFPDHVALRRILVFRHLRQRRFAEALASLTRIQALDRKEWVDYLEDHIAALAGLGRVDEAKALAADAFARQEGSQARLAGIHAWLSGSTSPIPEGLLRKLAAGDPKEQLELQVRFWTAPAGANLAPLAGEPDRAAYRVMQDAHYDPRAAVKDVLGASANDLSLLDLPVTVLLLGEAQPTRDPVAHARLETAAGRYLPVNAVCAYLDQGAWSRALEDLPLSLHGALHLARSRRDGLAPAERERLRALARDCDPLGGYVRMALARWPPP